jgi:hypothetical protein
VLGAATGVALGSDSATGSARAIAIARSVQRAYLKVRAYTFTQTGYLAIRDHEGSTSTFAWIWPADTVPRGYVKAVEHGVFALEHGRVVWWRDDLTPVCGGCGQRPVEVVVNRAGRFWTFGDAARHGCYGTLGGSSPVLVGDRVYAVTGRYAGPVRRGDAVLLSYSYYWAANQIATETDTVSARRLLTESGRISVAPGTAPSRPGFTITFRYAYPARGPAAPRVMPCG